MAESGNFRTPSWGVLLHPDADMRARLQAAGNGATYLAQCGGGRDAVVIAPLQRGLAVLDLLELPVEDGHSVIADYHRQELIVVVDDGWTHLWEDVPGVRVLSSGSWLLVPSPGGAGTMSAAWLSRPRRHASSLATRQSDAGHSLGRLSAGIDARKLREALAATDRAVTAAS